ncbi:tetratricopeptide repeat protein [Zavarzinella formosa]|uniref:hypothetical protein n=1 Tax=Zavarzinella formosa TaxID=360055 RepID=UPI0002DDC671|nr:hypothetical protein [Zavarzinella formosa]
MASTDPKKTPESDPARPPMAEAADIFAISEEGGEAFVDYGNVAPIHEGASGVIPLDELPNPPSGQSLTSWTEVIRRQRAVAEAEAVPTPLPNPSSVRVDAPSDKDLLSHLLEVDAARTSTGNSSAIPLAGPLPATASDTAEIPEADLPMVAEAAEAVDDGFDDLSPEMTGINSPSGGSQVHFGVMSPTGDTGGVHRPPPDASSNVWPTAPKRPAPADDDESIPFVASLEAGASSAMLGDMPAMGPEGNRSSILDVLLTESNLEIPNESDFSSSSARARREDIGNTPFRSTRPTDPAAGYPSRAAKPTQPTQPSFNVPDEVAEGALPAGLEEGTSESKYGLESIDATQFNDSDDAVDLYGDQVPQPSITDSGSLAISDEVIEEAARKQKIFESSSVDLSSRPSMHESEFDMDSPPLSGSHTADEDAIDLDLPMTSNPGDSSLIRAKDIDEESDNLREEYNTRRQQRAKPKQAEENEPELRPVEESSGARSLKGALIGTAAGLLIGAGGVFGAFTAGLIPSSSPAPVQQVAAVDPAELTRAREDAENAKTDLKEYQSTVAKAFAEVKIDNPEQGLTALPMIVGDRDKATAKVGELVKEAQSLQVKADAAAKAEEAAKKDLKTAQDALAASETKLTDATKASEEATTALAAVNKSFKDAGLDAAKPGEALKELQAKKTDAEKLVKETEAKAEKAAKDYETKIETATKQLTDAAKAAEEAKKSAAEAKLAADAVAKAKEAADGTLKALGDKLVKAKFVQANADSTAILKGLDDAIKAGTSDATLALRDELVKMRDNAAKSKADLETVTLKQQNTEKLAVAAEAQAKKAAEDLKTLTAKAESDMAAMKANGDKLSKEISDLTAKNTVSLSKANEAEKQLSKTMAELSATKEQLGGQIAKLKTENDTLTRDLGAVRELSLAIKAQANAGGPAAKPDPAAMADRFFSNGIRLFHASRYSEAETSLVKTIALFNDDARYHYLLGLALFNQGKTKEADEAFAKGAELEAQGRPSGKSIDAILERVQGRGRQLVNSHRP